MSESQSYLDAPHKWNSEAEVRAALAMREAAAQFASNIGAQRLAVAEQELKSKGKTLQEDAAIARAASDNLCRAEVAFQIANAIRALPLEKSP